MLKVYNNRISFKKYNAYEDVIDILLFNEIITFIGKASQNKNKNIILNKISLNCIWFEDIKDSNYQNTYQFEYLGELLERYEERIGNSDKVLRTIALAVSFGYELIDNNMIVGSQLTDFISKVNNAAQQGDLYCKASLCLIDKNKYYYFRNELLYQKYTKTEEIIFALSVFMDDIDEFIKYQKENIILLTGKQKTISAIGNTGLYAWFIKNIYPLFHNSRKNNEKVLKSLINLPTGFMKEESTIYKTLINNGYSHKEIAYMNYFLLFFKPVPKTVLMGKSIVEEKILIKFCKIFIDSQEELSSDVYATIRKLLDVYTQFSVKCYGYSNLIKALADEINITNPVTFKELYDFFGKRLYSFDILDSKWDVLQKLFNEEQYQRLFDQYLYENDFSKEKIVECIHKFDTLTNSNYLSTFYKRDWLRSMIFTVLVNKEILSLEVYWDYIVKNDCIQKANHLEEYIEGIHYRKAFDFFKYLLNLNKYNMREISEIGFRLDRLVGCISSSYRSNIDITRVFLTDEDKKLLFNCLDKYVFFNEPSKYIRFLESVIEDDTIINLYPKEDLRKIYLFLCQINPEKKKNNYLKELYLTADELEEIQRQERLEKERIKNEKILKMNQRVQSEFKKAKKNSFKDIFYHCHRYYNNEEEEKYLFKLAKDYIETNMNVFEKSNDNIIYFLQFLKSLLESEFITNKELIELICKYFKEDIVNNEIINESYECNIKDVSK